MTVTKVVDFVLGVPEHFSLHFSEFSKILYAFCMFTARIQNLSFKIYIWVPRKFEFFAIGSFVGGEKQRQEWSY